MRLAAYLAVGRPESGRLETQQVLRLDIAGLDAEHATGRQWLPNQRKDTALALAMRDKGFVHRLQCICRLQQ